MNLFNLNLMVGLSHFKDNLKAFLNKYFKHVLVFEIANPNKYTSKHLFFWASDSVIPFSPNWKKWVTN